MPSRLFLLVLLLAAAPACSDAPADDAAPTAAAPTEAPGPRLRGITLDAVEPPPPDLLPTLADLGTDHLALIPFAFQPAVDDPDLRMNPDARWYTESDRGIRALARQADSLGMAVVLKPHVWIGHGEDAWSAHIGFGSESGWAEWERRYRRFALHYARLSEEVGAPLFVIGTELGRAVREREAFWRGLIREIRAVYGGRLTYAANWHADVEQVPFWDALDAVGVQAYFPLTEDAAPTRETLERGWAEPLRTLEALHARTGKPVLFTEIGYRDVPYAAARPWEWPSDADDALPTDA
ncbi:MAG: hypothetical protein R3362_12080, partial [Rhodothermales bacterium]|nr:hypothetical protein [Rhodothermales bacterium]